MGDNLLVVNVEGAIHRNGKWLFILRSEKEEHAGGTLSLVGGKVDQEGASSDVLERTLKREIFEEVGVKVSELRYVNSSSFVTAAGIPVIDIVFLCEQAIGEPYAKSPDEVVDVVWKTTEEIINDPKLPHYLRENIKQADLLLNGTEMKNDHSK